LSKSRQLFFAFTTLFSVYLFLLHNVLNTYHRHDKIINEDAFGYYTILPAFFKYNDPNFVFLDSSIKKNDPFKSYIPPVVNTLSNNQRVCKYYAGVAILQFPFYWVGNQIAQYKKQNLGYESIYQMAILWSVILYLSFAIYFFLKSLQTLGVSTFYTLLLGALALFGTNIYCYTTYDPAYSHVYSMFAFNAFIYFCLKYKNQFLKLDLIKIGFFAGIILAIRPLNGLILLTFPIIIGLENFKTLLIRPKNLLLLSGFLFAPFIQSYLWFWQTGKWYVYPYINEHLEFNKPKIFELLFGFDCGWFIYTPMPFLALILSFYCLLKNKQIKFLIAVLLLSSSVIYLTSCWYYIHYGCTISCRPLAEYIFPIFLLFAFATIRFHSNKYFKILFVSLAFIGISYNQIIHYQFYNQIINWCKMDKEKFKMVFLKTHPHYAYSTSDFWNFESFEKKQLKDSTCNLSFSIHQNKPKDLNTIEIVGINSQASNILIELDLKIKMNQNLNESVLTMLLTENNQYIDLHHFLLKRVVKKNDEWVNYQYQIYISKPIKKCKLDFTLESINNKADTDLKIENVKIKSIDL
jgi:hypothetical protein